MINIAKIVERLSHEMGINLHRNGSKTIRGRHGIKASQIFNGTKNPFGALAYTTSEGEISVCIYFGKYPKLAKGKRSIYLILERFGDQLCRTDANRVDFLGYSAGQGELQGEHNSEFTSEAMRVCQKLYRPEKNRYVS